MDALYAGKIGALLQAQELTVSVLDTVDSTSSECRRRLAAGQTRALVLAERQSAGRGRQGKDFFSPAGRGLYMSLLFPPQGGIPAADGFTAYAAVAVRRAISEICGVDCGIKWVNDLYYRRKKVCGILTEAVGQSLIVGVGIDLISGELPEALSGIVGALDCPCDRNALCAAIVRGLLAWRPNDRSYAEEYRAASVVLGRRIRFLHQGTVTEAYAAELAPDGRLIAETAEGRILLGSGEISLMDYE